MDIYEFMGVSSPADVWNQTMTVYEFLQLTHKDDGASESGSGTNTVKLKQNKRVRFYKTLRKKAAELAAKQREKQQTPSSSSSSTSSSFSIIASSSSSSNSSSSPPSERDRKKVGTDRNPLQGLLKPHRY